MMSVKYGADTAVILCGGEVVDYEFFDEKSLKNAYIICADGGLRHAALLGVEPDLIVGDSDSWLCDYPGNAEVILYPPEKDFTDTNLCIDKAIERNFKKIVLIGALGGRADHEFSHLCLLAYGLKRGVKIKITDKHNEIWLENKSFKLKRGNRRFVSFFPFGGVVEGFSVRGLKYEAENMCLNFDEVRASSNEFGDSDIAEIDFKSGTLLVMLCDDRV